MGPVADPPPFGATGGAAIAPTLSELLVTLWGASLLILPLLALWLAVSLTRDARLGRPAVPVRALIVAALALLVLQVLLFRAPQMLPRFFYMIRGPEVTFFALPLWIGVEVWGAARATGWRRRWLFAAIFGTLAFLASVLAATFVLS
jgi:hypothetical protein